jgi:hypothetical protein
MACWYYGTAIVARSEGKAIAVFRWVGLWVEVDHGLVSRQGYRMSPNTF